MASLYRRCDREAFQSPLGTGLQAIQLSPYRAGLAEPNLQRLPVVSASTACFCPVGLSSLGKPLTQGSVAPNALLSAKGINYAPNAAHEEVEAVGNLDRARCALAGAVGQRATAVPADHLDARVLTQPGRERPRGDVRKQVDGPGAFLVDQDQAILPTATMRPLIDAEDAWGAGGRWFGSLPHQPQQRHPAGT